jgi:hypothetical protein
MGPTLGGLESVFDVGIAPQATKIGTSGVGSNQVRLIE